MNVGGGIFSPEVQKKLRLDKYQKLYSGSVAVPLSLSPEETPISQPLSVRFDGSHF